MRTTTLTTAALLGLGLLTPTQAATAAGETCRGVPATIVGAPGTRVVGTEGPDVIVTDGALSVDALGGDDLICVSFETGLPYDRVEVLAGAGDDVVDGTASIDRVAAHLGTGADTFAGGDAGGVLGDRITLVPDSSAPDVLHGGGGTDVLTFDSGAADVVVDNVAGSASVGGATVATWTGLEQFWLTRTGSRSLTFVGTDVDEKVVDSGTGSSLLTVDLAGGDDSFSTSGSPAPGSRVGGGDGTDRLEVASADARFALDLGGGVLVVRGDAGHDVATPGFEDASLTARRVVVDGTNGPNRVRVDSCDAVLRGYDGADVLRSRYASALEAEVDCRRRTAEITGGRGNDRLVGTAGRDQLAGDEGRDDLRGGGGPDLLRGDPGRDVLLGQGGRDRLVGNSDADTLEGGSGRDIGVGGNGRDTCRTEVRRSCER